MVVLQNQTKSNLTLPDATIEKPILVRKDEWRKASWELYLHHGIYLRREEDKGDDTVVEILAWKGFEIQAIYQIKDKPEYYITGLIDTKLYEYYLIEDLVREAFHSALQSQATERKVISLLFIYMKHLITNNQIEVQPLYEKFGFEEKWYMPDQYPIIGHKGIQSGVIRCWKEFLATPYDPDLAIECFQKQYQVTSIENKDIFFAWGLVDWMFFALMPQIGLMPSLGILGPGDAGISRLGSSISALWWMSLGKDQTGNYITKVVPSTTLPNLREFLTLPFPILIDDIDKEWGEDCLGFLKSFGTDITSWQIKNTKSEVILSYPYKSAAIYTFNEAPGFLVNPQMKSRYLVGEVKRMTKANNAETYLKTMREIPYGLIGRFIYEQTKAWTREMLLTLFYQQPDFHEDNITEERSRANIIYKYLQLGKYFCQEWFGITLDLTLVPQLIVNTRNVNNDELIEKVQQQIIAGDISEHFHDVVNRDGSFLKSEFQPALKWITSPIFPHDRISPDKVKQPGYIYTVHNLRDLYIYLGTHKIPSLRQFYLTIKSGIFYENITFIDTPLYKTIPGDEKRLQVRNAIWFSSKCFEV